jgi:hypothetical protein
LESVLAKDRHLAVLDDVAYKPLFLVQCTCTGIARLYVSTLIIPQAKNNRNGNTSDRATNAVELGVA